MADLSSIAASDLLSLDEAAKKIGVSFATLFNWTKNGIIRTVKIGGHRYAIASLLPQVHVVSKRRVLIAFPNGFDDDEVEEILENNPQLELFAA
jgi:excisionase family DNA binding protein